MEGFVDASLASCLDTFRSVGAFYFNLGSGAISWKSKYFNHVTPSSTETETVALFYATSECVWLRKLLKSFGYNQSAATVIFEDNQGAIKYAKSSDRYGRMKHISMKIFFTREKVLDKTINPTFIPSADNHADIMTKPLKGTKFTDHRQAIGVIDYLKGT